MPYKQKLNALLSKGYFPRELPAVFTTNDFGEHSCDILDEWKDKKVFRVKNSGTVPGTSRKKRNAYSYTIPAADIEIISKPKRGYERRNIHITHPLPQALLCYEIAKNWKSIQKWLSLQTFSLDEIRISNSHQRSIKGINFQIHRAKKGYVEATSDWLVKTDITRFYPSIYTHSIAWAAYGKERVKGNLRLYQGSLADRLDLLVRSCNRNQTIGIPIGPETSRIIAEIISSRIDLDFQQKDLRIPNEDIDRLQDDWFIGVNTLEKAETALSTVTAIYREYGLEINGTKTSIDRIVTSSQSTWISEISAFLSHKSGMIRGARLRELLSLSLRLQSQYPNESVISYSLSVIEGQKIAKTDVEALESFLLKAAVTSPISMDRICQIVLNLQHQTNTVSRKRIGQRFTQLAERNLENGNIYEVIWLLYTLRGLKIPLNSKRICSLIEVTPSSALALILLDMDSKKLCRNKLPKTMWADLITKTSVKSDWTWLLGYEGIRHGWLPDNGNVMDDAFFDVMATRNVVFYDPKRNVQQSSNVVQKRRQYRKLQFLIMQKFIQNIRGFEFDEHWNEY